LPGERSANALGKLLLLLLLLEEDEEEVDDVLSSPLSAHRPTISVSLRDDVDEDAGDES
jgi:hypothetical protein